MQGTCANHSIIQYLYMPCHYRNPEKRPMRHWIKAHCLACKKGDIWDMWLKSEWGSPLPKWILPCYGWEKMAYIYIHVRTVSLKNCHRSTIATNIQAKTHFPRTLERPIHVTVPKAVSRLIHNKSLKEAEHLTVSASMRPLRLNAGTWKW